MGVNGVLVASVHILTEDQLIDMIFMVRPCWGHTVTAITMGFLWGGVLIMGGFISVVDGEIIFVEGFEIYFFETL